jgi:hypothetical protein
MEMRAIDIVMKIALRLLLWGTGSAMLAQSKRFIASFLRRSSAPRPCGRIAHWMRGSNHGGSLCGSRTRGGILQSIEVSLGC